MTSPVTASIPLSSSQRWRAFWVCVSVAAFTILDLSKVNVGLPAIETSLGATSTQLQLVVSGYILTFGLALVPFGRLGDQRSRKALFIIGLSLFTLTSAACALAPSIEVLMAARLVQGIAAGIQMPQVMGTIQQLFTGKERGRAFGLFGATIGIATAFGPTLGGLMIAIGGETDGWRGIFWFNVPLCLLVLAGVIWLLPQTRTASGKRLQLDPIGIVLFAFTVISLMWPFLFTTGSPDDDPNRWWLLTAFVLFATLFFWWERRYAASGRQPLIPFRMFRIPSYRNGTFVVVAYFTAIPPMFLLGTLFLQIGVGLEPVFAGMVSIGFAVASAFSSYYGGLLVNRFGRQLVTIGLLTVLVSVVALTIVAYTMPPETVAYGMAAALLVAGAGGGLVVSPNQTLTLSEIPVREGGLAGSVGQLGQRVGTAVGTAIGLSLFYATIYRESGAGLESLAVFHDAYAYGMAAVGLFLAIATLISVVDLINLRRRGAVSPASE
ncbi:MFS transporter [Microbacterium aquilitoris]|uniref:MFS transporter n=1 Tax=Microbacterium aquilitoris TaxID=3067307 RepID=A0ABU3GGY1_9MICO|nr:MULTISPECIES: MFS transporter [unclassified Microbacterium]MDT3329962.1 MFS transporter [Microbacterium sp. KSW-18]MDT3345795.1 MFS transporter [Microbacterium sp. KSW2-22]